MKHVRQQTNWCMRPNRSAQWSHYRTFVVCVTSQCLSEPQIKLDAPTVSTDRTAVGSRSSTTRSVTRWKLGPVDNSLLFNQLPIPVSFRCLELGSPSVDYATGPVSIFHNGFVITSPRKLRTGSLISIRMRMPPEKKGERFWDTRCLGRVVAEQKLKDGGLAYKIEFEIADLPA